ncbi:MAG: DUF4905 domain-containing protein [Chloroherpetonaceae bacterium]|nr:DUF4905 domain-containing protein [Chloroherpetonaceae bacterium]
MLGLFKKRLKPIWQFHKPNGLIWRALFLDPHYLIGEFRERGARKVSFFLLDTETGKLIWDNFVLIDTAAKPVGDGWWVGMETVYRGLVLFHGYYSPNVPEHLGIWAFDPLTKTLRWVRPDVSYLCIVDDQLLAVRNVLVDGYVERAFLSLNPLTGEAIEDFGQNTAAVNALRERAPNLLEEQNITLPEHITEQSPNYAIVAKQAQMQTGAARVVAGFDVLTYQGKTILGYHEQTAQWVTNQAGLRVQALNYKLFVLDEKQAIIYEDILGAQMSGLLVDGFFMRQNRLYYVKETNMLCAVELFS